GPGGRRYSRTDYGALRVPFPRFAVVLRADLQQHLVHAAERAGVRVELERRCTAVVGDRAATGLQFADGRTAECGVVLAGGGRRAFRGPDERGPRGRSTPRRRGGAARRRGPAGDSRVGAGDLAGRWPAVRHRAAAGSAHLLLLLRTAGRVVRHRPERAGLD